VKPAVYEWLEELHTHRAEGAESYDPVSLQEDLKTDDRLDALDRAVVLLVYFGQTLPHDVLAINEARALVAAANNESEN
jgi:methionyl-tRNA formyltransferase